MADQAQRRLPEWLKVKAPGGRNYLELRQIIKGGGLHTVCEEARCPNIGECWDRKTATFMVLGDICTRACAYCAVDTGRPLTVDALEPLRLAETVHKLGLRYAVITSVDRDDLPDGGAFIFAQCITQIHKRLPTCKVEVLIPDFQGDWAALASVMEAKPETLNHNIETVRRVFSRVRPKGDYDLSLELLAKAKELATGSVTKSGMMVGLGETWDEILETMRDLRSVDCDLLTIGQYLRPSPKHAPLARWYTPDEFKELQDEGHAMGFSNVASGPLVRSSYHADEQHEAATRVGV
ncbi:MAG: lipoyl synthase [SAR202 cluster bacterium Casp-Chloro-G4]|nr:lipoyl synthase [Chloroflexota bacterium]MDA1227417.1 lipoyl synthase [Chloroflexota bacterium]PKB62139.1 MAG: lipoyl synthase [SAR202 cluster bacterium Casp-Chloro-G4]